MSNYVPLLLINELGASKSFIGLALLASIVTESFVFFNAKLLTAKFGLRLLIVASHIAYLVRFIGYSIINEPWQILFLELMHGLTFSCFWNSAIKLANDLSTKEVAATAQSLWQG